MPEHDNNEVAATAGASLVVVVKRRASVPHPYLVTIITYSSWRHVRTVGGKCFGMSHLGRLPL